MDGSNLLNKYYILDGKAADDVVYFATQADKRLNGKLPAFDPAKHVVVAVLQTYDEPDMTCLILDKTTLQPVFAQKNVNPFNFTDLAKDLPAALKKDARIKDDSGDIDGFKVIAALLAPGKEIDLKLKNKDDAAWRVKEWLDE
jgi:hypothetical protein